MTDPDQRKRHEANAQEVIDSLTEEGKEISIVIKITDQKLAQELMSTMYPRAKTEMNFGVEVLQWGFFNCEKAKDLKLLHLKALHEKQQMEYDQLVNTPDSEFLTMGDPYDQQTP